MWGEDALVFNPDRWLEERDKSGALIGVYANLYGTLRGIDRYLAYLREPLGYRSLRASRTASVGDSRTVASLSKFPLTELQMPSQAGSDASCPDSTHLNIQLRSSR